MMTSKLNRDEILKELIQTLIDGWGHGAVLDSLQRLGSPLSDRIGRNNRSGGKDTSQNGNAAAQMVAEMSIPPEKKKLILQLAERFDEGNAFPKITDVRSFLMSHQHEARDIKGRYQAFKLMLPVLIEMSEKGLEKVISRSHYSGPAELEAISNAIRGAGEDLRGARRFDQTPSPEDRTDKDTMS